MKDSYTFNHIVDEEFDGKTTRRTIGFDIFEEQLSYLISNTKKIRSLRWPPAEHRSLIGIYKPSFTIKDRSITTIKIWKHTLKETYYFEVHKYDKEGKPVIRLYRWIGAIAPTV